MNPTTQRLEALQVANRVRVNNATLKRGLTTAPPAQARRDAADLILTSRTPDDSARIPVVTLLRAIRQAGDARAFRWIASAGIMQSRKIGTLTSRQREALAALLKEDAERIEIKGGKK